MCLCTCFSVSETEGQMKVTDIATRPLVQDLLSHDVSCCSDGCIQYTVYYTFHHSCFNISSEGNDLFSSCFHVFRTATSWIREGRRSLCGRGRKQTKLRDKPPWPELWWETLHHTFYWSYIVCLFPMIYLTVIGVHQSQKLPHRYECGDSERRCRVSSLQAAVPEVDCKGPDSRSGESAYKGESGYVCYKNQKWSLIM